ncbi:hypothetical protein E4U32_005251 [Claviceps aff. humidiphila group G2b]|nr:hypothetical protein E4U32_005251 [Claviceps aff. humidiphila group G2b]
MAQHMNPGEARGADYRMNNHSAGVERMSIQSILSGSGSSEIRLICDGSQLSRHLPLPDSRDSVSASRPTNTSACVEHRHLDSAIKPSHSATCPLPGDKKWQRSENKSPNRHVYQGNEVVSEGLDNSEAEDEIKEGVSPGSQEVEDQETSLSSVLAALNENWDEFFTSQLHAYYLPHVRARYRHQQRAAAMRYPASLPLKWLWLPRTDQGG